MAINKETLSYNVAFEMTIGCEFRMNGKEYIYIGQTFERLDDGHETIAIVREIGTMNYKALNMSKYGDRLIEFLY